MDFEVGDIVLVSGCNAFYVVVNSNPTIEDYKNHFSISELYPLYIGSLLSTAVLLRGVYNGTGKFFKSKQGLVLFSRSKLARLLYSI